MIQLNRFVERPDAASGRLIIESIVEAMTGGLEELYTRTIAPELFQVYLHPSDYRRLEGIFRLLQDEAETALDQEVAAINRSLERWPQSIVGRLLDRFKPYLTQLPGLSRRSLTSPGRGAQKVVRPRNGWQVTFNRNEDPDTAVGDIVIDAVLMLPQKAELGMGMTTKSVRTIFRTPPTQSDAARRGQVDSSVGTLQLKVEKAPLPASNQESAVVPYADQGVGGGWLEVLAKLKFHDNEGERTYLMTKSSIVIGRGGTGVWTDVKLVAGPNVSREHLRIREKNGQFFLKDVSAFGTSINGISVPGSMVRSGIQLIDKDIWVQLPSPSRISLAGVVEIEFTASREKA